MPLLALCIIMSWSSVNSNLSYSPEMLKLGQYWWYFASCDLEISQMTFKNNKASHPHLFKHYASFRSHQWIKIWVTVRQRSNQEEFDDFLHPVTLKSYRWLWKTLGHLFYTHSSFIHYFIAIGGFRFKIQSGNAQTGSNLTNFCILWPWNFKDEPDKQ